MHVYACVCTRVYACARVVYVCTRVYARACMCVCTRVRACVCMCTCVLSSAARSAVAGRGSPQELVQAEESSLGHAYLRSNFTMHAHIYSQLEIQRDGQREFFPGLVLEILTENEILSEACPLPRNISGSKSSQEKTEERIVNKRAGNTVLDIFLEHSVLTDKTELRCHFS